LDQQRQFRIESVEIIGLNPETQHQLRHVPRTGDIFRNGKIEQFYKLNRALLPAGSKSWTSMSLERDVRNQTVALVFDFRPPLTCPQWDE
jgi:hypothetical protein